MVQTLFPHYPYFLRFFHTVRYSGKRDFDRPLKLDVTPSRICTDGVARYDGVLTRSRGRRPQASESVCLRVIYPSLPEAMQLHRSLP